MTLPTRSLIELSGTFYFGRFFIECRMAQNLDSRCVLISDPSTLGAGDKTRLHTPKAVTYHEQPHYCRFMIGHSLGRMETRIKKFTPYCVCRPERGRSGGACESS